MNHLLAASLLSAPDQVRDHAGESTPPDSSTFFAAVSSTPLTDIHCNATSRTLMSTFHDTTLTSGKPVSSNDAASRNHYSENFRPHDLPPLFHSECREIPMIFSQLWLFGGKGCPH